MESSQITVKTDSFEFYICNLKVLYAGSVHIVQSFWGFLIMYCPNSKYLTKFIYNMNQQLRQSLKLYESN